jgi:hypothetical protein
LSENQLIDQKQINETNSSEKDSDQNILFYKITSSNSNLHTNKTTSRDNISTNSNINIFEGNFTSLANSRVFHPKEKKSKLLFTFKENEFEEENQFDTTMEDDKLLKELDLESHFDNNQIEKTLKRKFKEKEVVEAGPFCTKCRIF